MSDDKYTALGDTVEGGVEILDIHKKGQERWDKWLKDEPKRKLFESKAAYKARADSYWDGIFPDNKDM